MWARSLAVFLTLVVSALALPSPDFEHKVKEQLSGPPRGWTITGPAPSDHFIQLRIALPQPNFHVLEEHLYAVSDPSHERYGQHLSKEEVEELVAPHPDSVDAVTGWLASHGFDSESTSRSPAGDWLTIRVSVSKAEEMLNTASFVFCSEISPSNCTFRRIYRNITSGSTRMAIISSAPPLTAFRLQFSIMWS